MHRVVKVKYLEERYIVMQIIASLEPAVHPFYVWRFNNKS